MAYLKTYTLFLRGGGDEGRFEPALCLTASEAMARARELLADHAECEAIEVFLGDSLLFRVARADG
jgi:hypothetical protein